MRILNRFAASLLLVIFCLQAHGLSTDRDQPATIEADEVEFDFNTGERTYIGNVIVLQGTLKITGDKIVVQYKNDELESATSWGSPATFKQRPDGKDEDVYGEGNTIVLNEIKNTLTLIEDASLTQGPNTAHGSKIVYNMGTDKLRVKGFTQTPSDQQGEGEDGVTKTESGRAKVVIKPGSQSTAPEGSESQENQSE